MSYLKICDRCKREIDDEYIRIGYIKRNKRINKDFHIDCFNFEFSCDIRKMENETK